MANIDKEGTYPKGRFTRRQVIKAGGIAALGLAFSKPAIETLQPRPVWAQVSPGITPGGTGGGLPVTQSFNPSQIQSVSDDPSLPAGSGVGGILLSQNGHTSRALIKFDVSLLPSNASIQNASVTAQVFAVVLPLSGSNDVSVHEVTADWSSGPLTAFTNPGHDSTVIYSNTISGPPAAYSWSIDPLLVQSWLTPSSNFGILLKGDESNPAYEIAFGLPLLQVTYTTGD